MVNPSSGLKDKVHPLGAMGLVIHFSTTSMSPPPLTHQAINWCLTLSVQLCNCKVLATTCLALVVLKYSRVWACAGHRAIWPAWHVGEVWPCAQHWAWWHSHHQPPCPPEFYHADGLDGCNGKSWHFFCAQPLYMTPFLTFTWCPIYPQEDLDVLTTEHADDYWQCFLIYDCICPVELWFKGG